MSFQIKIFAILLGFLFLFILLKTIRKTYLKPAFSMLWIFIACFLISVPIFEGFYRFVAYEIFGFYNATDVIYIGSIFFLAIYIFHLTVQLNGISDQVKILISQVAILEKEIRENKKRE